MKGTNIILEVEEQFSDEEIAFFQKAVEKLTENEQHFSQFVEKQVDDKMKPIEKLRELAKNFKDTIINDPQATDEQKKEVEDDYNQMVVHNAGEREKMVQIIMDEKNTQVRVFHSVIAKMRSIQSKTI